MIQQTVLNQITFVGFLTLVALPNGTGDFVLCKGEDGHLEIEYSQQGSCYSLLSKDGHGTTLLASTMEKDHCGSCVDMAFPSLSGVQRLPNYSGTAQALHASAAFARWSFPETLTTPLFPQPPPFASPSLVGIRTVRLLI